MRTLHSREKTELKRLLTQLGLTDPEQILAILDTFLATEDHLTETELIRRLKSRGLTCDPGLVRRALDLFCRYGFAQVKSFKDQVPRYEHRHLGDHHDHFICTRCGRVEEFINPEMEELQVRLAKDKGFVPLQHRMEIYGLCSTCAEARRPAAPLCEAEPGERLLVTGYQGGQEAVRHLTDMGLTPGAELEVLSANGGPVVVSCRGSRLALGRGLSEKVLVTPVQEDEEE